MKNKKETISLAALFGLLGYLHIGNDPRTSTYLIYSIVLFLSMSLLFFGQAFYLYPRFLLKKKVGYYLLYSVLPFAILYLITTFLFHVYFKAIVELKPGKSFSIIQNMLAQPLHIENLMILGIIMMLGLVYAVIRQLVKAKRRLLLKRIAVFSFISFLIIAIAIGVKYYVDVNWKGSHNIHFITDQNHQSLEEIIRLPQFKNKVVYVDLWFTSCTPCLQEFQQLPKVKEQLKGKPVEYLYLAHETSLPNDRQRWKNIIKKFSLNGWHLYMPPQFEKSIWKIIEKHAGIKNRYPQYLLIDRNGKVVSYDAYRPQDKEKIVGEIENLLD